MRNPLLFLSREVPPVLSLQAEADRFVPRREQGQFEVLFRHLLHRFFHHELLASENETKRLLQFGYAVTLPTLIVSLFLFVPYHAMPPMPRPRPFWSQVGDHYFFVMYSFVLLGLATVYEWDLLFPDLLDVYVLSVLPIPNKKLFAARVSAVAVFLVTVLTGTSLLGTVFFPLIAELPTPWRHLLAHAIAVTISGAFAAAVFLALQGVLFNVLGERWFRRLGPLFQGLSLMLLLAILLLTPAVNRDIQSVLTVSTAAVRWFPPFWFLGLYERLLHGSRTPALFVTLSTRGIWALAVATGFTVLTYPLAYRRRVRQLIEGEAASKPRRSAASWHRCLHGTLLRKPAHRVTFYLAGQTVLRSQRHRVMLALYGGLMAAIVISESVVLRVSNGHLRPGWVVQGIRAAVPVAVFLGVVGLTGATWAPVDRRGAWIFAGILGRPRPDHLRGTKRWVTFWAALLGVLTAVVFRLFGPASLRGSRVLVDQLVVAVGLAVVFADLYLYSKESLPFTALRVTSITDFPLAVLRNFIVFPLVVGVLVSLEPGFEQSWGHVAKLAFAFWLTHLAVERLYSRSKQHLNAEVLVAEEDVFPLSLGLRDGG